ncbi:MAG TPA: molybdopterin-dependent oxidoreductase [Blastocatellia bacterium]|nr:molybdopterin-dependent oxidoreductase [Blastocatellia bacterium]
MKRREFIILSGIGATSASLLSACGHPEEKLIPAFIPDDEYVPGIDYWKASTCGMCPAGCGIIVRTREHKANKIEGNPLHPVNRGALCARGQAGLEVLYNPDRIKGPMKRVGERGEGKWEEISWDEGIKTLADKLTEIKAQNRAAKSAFIIDDRSLVTAHVVKRLMDAYGAHSFLMRPPFNEVGADSESGSSGALTFDLANATYLLSFGARFLETWLSPVMYSLAYGEFRRSNGKARGKFVHVEPRMSLTAANADEWLPAQVGSEALVALAIAQVIVRENLSRASLSPEFIEALQDFAPEKTNVRSDVPADTVIRIAEEFTAAERPLAIGSRYSTNREWVNLLNVLVGNRDKKGGVLTIPSDNEIPFAKWVPDFGLNHRHDWELRELLEYHSEGAILISQANPLHITPALREQFNRVSFIASFSSFMDETTQMADLVLPDPSYLEAWDIAPSYSPNGRVVAGLTQPVIHSSLNTMQTADVLCAVSREMGGELAAALPFSSTEDFVRQAAVDLAKSSSSIKTENAEDFWNAFSERGVWIREPDSKPASQPVVVEWPAAESLNALDQLKPRSATENGNSLTLTVYEHSTLGYGATSPALQELPDPMTSVIWGSWVEINPQTARSLGILDGDLVEVSTEHGSLRVPAVLYPAIHRNVIAMPFGQGHTGYGRYATNRGANPAVLNPGLKGGVPAKVSKVEGKANLIRFGTDLQEHMEKKSWR